MQIPIGHQLKILNSLKLIYIDTSEVDKSQSFQNDD